MPRALLLAAAVFVAAPAFAEPTPLEICQYIIWDTVTTPPDPTHPDYASYVFWAAQPPLSPEAAVEAEAHVTAIMHDAIAAVFKGEFTGGPAKAAMVEMLSACRRLTEEGR